MAVLVVSSRKFADMIERSCVIHNSLKLRTMVKRLRHPKNSGNNHQVNLDQRDAMELTGLWFTAAFEPEQRSLPETLVELDALHRSADNADERVPPVIIYSMSEWKSIVEIGTGLTSTIDLRGTRGNDPVYLNLKSLWPSVEDYVHSMIRRVYCPNHRAYLERERLKKDEIPQGGAAFGAVETDTADTLAEALTTYVPPTAEDLANVAERFDESERESLPSIPEDSGLVDHDN